MNPILYQDETERRQHRDSIRVLAKELKIDESEVAQVYENVLMTVKNQVTIIHYLPIFVPRRVRRLLSAGVVDRGQAPAGAPS